eukprot:TRINITY_DN19286_c0_g1_i1.p2 TRINITY_DN19286_c0_g1~~TRINITY_DN19286_c0_g1_i1.p2  ORF type:complete len:145 (-),score=9.26 TRINITY_DN19286_c0_g1_i1:18-452(-)
METIQRQFVERGVWVRPFGRLVYVMPPYVISDDDLDTLTSAICEVVSLQKQSSPAQAVFIYNSQDNRARFLPEPIILLMDRQDKNRMWTAVHAGDAIDEHTAVSILGAGHGELSEVMHAAHTVTARPFGREVSLCAIANVRSGN